MSFVLFVHCRSQRTPSSCLRPVDTDSLGDSGSVNGQNAVRLGLLRMIVKVAVIVTELVNIHGVSEGEAKSQGLKVSTQSTAIESWLIFVFRPTC